LKSVLLHEVISMMVEIVFREYRTPTVYPSAYRFEMFRTRKWRINVSSFEEGIRIAESIHDLARDIYIRNGFEIAIEGERKEAKKWVKVTVLERGLDKVKVETELRVV